MNEETIQSLKEKPARKSRQTVSSTVKRVPLREQKRIAIAQEEGYYYRLVNDEGDRIHAFRKAGYEFVESEIREGEKKSTDASQFGKVACQSVGNGVMAYYMRIPEELHKEDEMKKQKILDEKDSRIGVDKIPAHLRRGKIQIDYGPIKD